jgi:hypothetical protein
VPLNGVDLGINTFHVKVKDAEFVFVRCAYADIPVSRDD